MGLISNEYLKQARFSDIIAEVIILKSNFGGFHKKWMLHGQ